MLKPSLSAIVATANKRVIGNKNSLPWRLPEDLQYFKQVTMGKPLIMGRLTFESLGKPLPGRPHVVVTRQNHWSYPGVDVAHSLEAAIEKAYCLAQEMEVDEVMVVGGANVYHQALPLLEVIYKTEIKLDVEGDAWFPELDSNVWEEQERSGPYKSEKSGLDYSFVIFRKRQRF